MKYKFPLTVKFLFALAVCMGMAMVTGTGRASANHLRLNPDPGPSGMPANVRAYLQGCGHSNESPGFFQWVSAAGAPASTTVNVAYGAPSVTLRFNFVGVVCYPNSAVPETRLGVLGSSASPPGVVSGINGAVLQLSWGSAYRTVGAYRSAARNFTYAPNGGFRTSGYYTITLDNRVINRFSSGVYGCVAAGGGNPGGWNYSRCPRDPPGFTVYVNVAPRPVDRGSCSMNGPTSVFSGQSFPVNFRVDNLGNTPGANGGYSWAVNNGQSTRYRLNRVSAGGIPLFPGTPVIQEIRGGQVQQTGFGPILYQGRFAQWTSNFTAPGLGQYQIRYIIYGSNSNDGLHTVGTACTHTVNVVEQPYFRTYGGDVSLGAGQEPSCRIDANASLIGITNSGHTAAGSQLAQFALGVIFDVASGQVRGGPNPPNELAFANTAHHSPPGDPWAGNYGTFGGGLAPDNATCAPDFWEGAENIRPDNFAIGNTNLGMRQRLTYYVDGDVFINGNITYANGSFNDIEDIPSFRLIARGNIYVAPGVSELNGLFVSIPRNPASPTDGRFYTCWPGHIPTAGDINNACRNTRLIVYGAVVAEQIKLTRSSGSAHTSSGGERYDGLGFFAGTAAERFIYTPEVWLTSELSGNGSELDALMTLPPVL